MTLVYPTYDYDYTLQVWTQDDIVLDCEHPARMQAECLRLCNGRRYAGQPVAVAHTKERQG